MNKKTLDQFIDAFEKDDVSLFDGILSDDVEVDSSAVGKFVGIEEAKKRFKWQGIKLDFYKCRIYNDVYRKKGEDAIEAFYAVLIMGTYGKDFLNLFQTCFRVVLRYKNDKITSIKATQTFEHGNSIFVSSWWNMIDYNLYDGFDRVIINGYKDNPWLVIPNCEIALTEEEKIRDTHARYCFDIDTWAFDDLENVGTETCNVIFSENDRPDRRQWINYYKDKRVRTVDFGQGEFIRENIWNHIFLIKEIMFTSDNTAEAVIERSEPNRIGTRFQHKYNINTIYYHEVWNIEFKKNDQGRWLFNGFLKASNDLVQINEDASRRYF